MLKELVLPYGFDPVAPSFTVKDVTTEQCRVTPIEFS
ncbi:unnamed protein product [Schistosoma curassoni]|uniref:Coenzyme PQQ synthesis protein A n=1 Tax=Schistosoma curassoni TaxID=6186 RepID=A0A183KGH4_9TREM|nr:unnamed protein product [Schistosoma curassoni]